MAAEIEEPQVEDEADGAEEDEAGEGGDQEADAKQPRPWRRKAVMGLAGLMVIGAMGAGGAWYFGLPGSMQQPTEAVRKPALFYDLPDLTINLASINERSQYLRIKVSLEVSDRKTIEEITPMLPRVMDAFQVYLRELRITDLEGSAGIYRLKEELRRRVNLAVHPAQVDDILFRELLIQ
jgi:flagellar FliL protein